MIFELPKKPKTAPKTSPRRQRQFLYCCLQRFLSVEKKVFKNHGKNRSGSPWSDPVLFFAMILELPKGAWETTKEPEGPPKTTREPQETPKRAQESPMRAGLEHVFGPKHSTICSTIRLLIRPALDLLKPEHVLRPKHSTICSTILHDSACPRPFETLNFQMGFHNVTGVDVPQNGIKNNRKSIGNQDFPF